MKREKLTEQEIIRREKLEKIKHLGIDPYYSKFRPDIYTNELTHKFDQISKEELSDNYSEEIYKISGRIMTMRSQGKTAFLTIQDSKGTMQLYLRNDLLSPENWELLQLIDIGDIIGVRGHMMKTMKGELTLKANLIELVTKSLTPLPDKFHGLSDKEIIYRKRYLDLIMNEHSKNVFIKRFKIISNIRETLKNEGYYSVETPVLASKNTGAAAKPFITHHNALGMDFNLRIATELPLKRLLVGGIDKVYELGRIFRNEGISKKHNPEFTSVEIYEAYGDVNSMATLTEKVIIEANHGINDSSTVIYEDQEISLAAPFKRIEMVDAIKEITDVDFNKVETFEEAIQLAKMHKVPLKNHYNSVGYIINAFFEEKVEETLVQPTFITGYPVEVSPLSKLRQHSTTIVDRFELFIGGREYANGYSELTDPEDQYTRFLKQIEEQNQGNDEATDMDFDYIEALEYGMPHSGGVGIGIDRLVMLLTNSSSIRDVLLFPHQRDKHHEK